MENCKRPISIVIPTIGKVKNITNQLINTISPFVDEIILFDNARKFNKKELSDNVLCLRKNNHYVNPAWNKGTEMSRNDFVILMNDDILFDPLNGKIFDEIIFELENKVFCLLGMDEATMIPFDDILPDKLSTSSFYCIEAPKERPRNFGAIIAFKKSNYMKIPEEMQIFFGDDYLYNFLPLKDKYTKSVGLMNFTWYHRVSSSSENVTSDTIDYETAFWGQIVHGLNARLDEYYRLRGLVK